MTVGSTTGAGTGASGTSGAGSSTASKDVATALTGLEVDDFFQLMIAELQNQDPLNPLENHQMLQQVSQIQEYGATQKLNQTLESVLLGQNLSNATSLIGKNVAALTNDDSEITGVVDRVTVANSKVTLHVGENEVSLANVREILPGE